MLIYPETANSLSNFNNWASEISLFKKVKYVIDNEGNPYLQATEPIEVTVL